MERALLSTAVGLALALSCTCRSQPGELALDLVGPASAAPLFFHGNCFAGWSVGFELAVRETGGVSVLIDSLSYRAVDAGTSLQLASERLAAEAITERYGERLIPARGQKQFSLGGLSGTRPLGPLRIDAQLAGRDQLGARVSALARLEAPLEVRDPAPGTGGACALAPP